MLKSFGKKPAVVAMCIFSIALVGAAFYVAFFDQSIFAANTSNMVYLVVTEGDIGKVASQSQHDVRINRKPFRYTHELPRKKF